MFDVFKKVLSQISAVNALTRLEKVRANVPQNAQYVTVVDMAVSAGPVELSDTQTSVMGATDSMEGKGLSSIQTAYMIHDGVDLRFIGDNQQLLFSTALTNVARLQSIASMKVSMVYGTMRGGFICTLQDGRSIIVSTPTPVATDKTMQFRTVGRSTDITGGWAKELEPFGVRVFY